MCTLLLFPFCAALCSSSISHITLTLVSPQSSPRSFITVSFKRWLGSLECHGNAVPQCVYTHSCICIFWCVCVWVCLDPCVWVHSCMRFSILGVLLFFLFYSEGAGDMKVCRCSDREKERQCKSTESSGENSGGAQKQQQAEGKEDDSAF